MAPQVPCGIPLKPCPFCGDAANLAHFRESRGEIVEEEDLKISQPYASYVECRSCQVRGPEVLFRFADDNDTFRAKQMAVRKWNDRN